MSDHVSRRHAHSAGAVDVASVHAYVHTRVIHAHMCSDDDICMSVHPFCKHPIAHLMKIASIQDESATATPLSYTTHPAPLFLIPRSLDHPIQRLIDVGDVLARYRVERHVTILDRVETEIADDQIGFHLQHGHATCDGAYMCQHSYGTTMACDRSHGDEET